MNYLANTPSNFIIPEVKFSSRVENAETTNAKKEFRYLINERSLNF